MAYINGEEILNVEFTGIVNVDQEYTPESENPQSGKAVAQAVAEKPWQVIEDYTMIEGDPTDVFKFDILGTKLKGLKELHISAYIVPAYNNVTNQSVDFGIAGKAYWTGRVNTNMSRIYAVMDITISPRKTPIFDGTISSYDYTLSGTSYKGLGYFRTVNMTDEGFTDFGQIDNSTLWLRTTSANPFAVGTRIKVWGR